MAEKAEDLGNQEKVSENMERIGFQQDNTSPTITVLPASSMNNSVPQKRFSVTRENEEASEVIRPLLSSSAPTVLTESPEQRKEIRANDIETGLKSHLTKKRFRQRSQALVSGLSYCLASCSMILLNKLVLSSYKWEAQICLMLYQNFVSVVLVVLLAKLKLIQFDPLTLRLVTLWLPVNFIFVGMLISSFFSLKYMQVAMVMVLKNMTNLVTAVGEMYLFQKIHTRKVWASLLLMVVSALCGGITDLSFHPIGYSWQVLNCFFTAAYSLTLRKVMDKAKAATPTGRLSEFTMVMLNNSLSFPLGFALVFLFGETKYLTTTPLLQNPVFWLSATLSGFMGLAISFTSMWFLHETSPTTYSLVGSLNKIPLSIAGIIMFKAPMSIPNLGSIMFGCFAGILFARAKLERS